MRNNSNDLTLDKNEFEILDSEDILLLDETSKRMNVSKDKLEEVILEDLWKNNTYLRKYVFTVKDLLHGVKNGNGVGMK